MVVLNIIVVLALLSLMIIVHEFGHWIVARKLGFQTPIFGFGLPFGGHIKLGRWKDTEFRFHWFVLGGYVAIPELGDESQEELKKEIPDLKPMKSFPVWKRAVVASAGVAFNIIFAYLTCLIMVATVGAPSSKGNVIITNLMDSVSASKLNGVEANPIAKNAGIKAGDIVLEVNDAKIKNPTQVVNIVMSNPEKEVVFKIPSAILIIVGGGGETQKAQELIVRLGLEKNIIIIGKKPFLELPKYINASDVLAVPSVWMEAFGQVTIEGMSCGVPVVTSDAGASPEINIDGETGLVVPRANSAQLASALIRILTDSDLRKRLGANARSRVLKNYTYEAITKKFLAIIQELF